MITKNKAISIAKENNINILKCDGGYMVGNIKLTYCGYGNNYKFIENGSAIPLGNAIIYAVNKLSDKVSIS